jgi:ABC-2 type transport system ATP-binding protein
MHNLLVLIIVVVAALVLLAVRLALGSQPWWMRGWTAGRQGRTPPVRRPEGTATPSTTPPGDPPPRVVSHSAPAPLLVPGGDGALDGEPALRVDHLTKRFGERTAFEDVSFEVAVGEVFGFLGPNGAGKTTIVRTLGTLLTATSGTASVAGLPLTPDNAQEIRQRIAIMPESPGLYLRLSVRENMELFAALYGLPHPRERIVEALEAVNLTERAADLCGSLSKGLRQRAGLARTLLHDPAVIFLDEPTSGLDPVASREVHELINALRQRGTTVFLTTHRLEEAERLCDRVAILNTTLRLVGRTDELRQSLFSRALVVETAIPLADPASVFAPTRGATGWRSDGGGDHYMVDVDDPRRAAPEITRALVAAGADVITISESRHSLEDVYLQLINEDPEASR